MILLDDAEQVFVVKKILKKFQHKQNLKNKILP
jgi:hypothetical protein